MCEEDLSVTMTTLAREGLSGPLKWAVLPVCPLTPT